MEGEGFSPDFNWKTFKKRRREKRDSLIHAELAKIEKQITLEIDDPMMNKSSDFKLSDLLSVREQEELILELYKRFPGRLMANNVYKRWLIDPTQTPLIDTSFTLSTNHCNYSYCIDFTVGKDERRRDSCENAVAGFTLVGKSSNGLIHKDLILVVTTLVWATRKWEEWEK